MHRYNSIGFRRAFYCFVLSCSKNLVYVQFVYIFYVHNKYSALAYTFYQIKIIATNKFLSYQQIISRSAQAVSLYTQLFLHSGEYRNRTGKIHICYRQPDVCRLTPLKLAYLHGIEPCLHSVTMIQLTTYYQRYKLSSLMTCSGRDGRIVYGHIQVGIKGIQPALTQRTRYEIWCQENLTPRQNTDLRRWAGSLLSQAIILLVSTMKVALQGIEPYWTICLYNKT